MIKIGKFQIFLEAIQAMNSEQQQPAIIEEFFDDILTVFTVCMEFVKIFSCMINQDATIITGKLTRNAEVFSEKLVKEDSFLTAEHSARNTIVGNIPPNRLCDKRDGDLLSNSRNEIKSMSASSSSSDKNMKSFKTCASSISTQLNRKDDQKGDRDSNIDIVGITDNNRNSNSNSSNIQTGLNSTVNIRDHVHTTNIRAHVHSTILSPSSAISKNNILELLELSLSIAILFCNISLSVTYNNLREKQSGGDGLRAKAVEDKKICRQD